MSNTGQLESKEEVHNCSKVELENKELCEYKQQQQQQQQQREASPLYTYKVSINYQKELERQIDSENSLPTYDKVLPSEMQSIQMLESANVTSVEKQHHNRQYYCTNDKSDEEEMEFSNLQDHVNAEEHSHPPVNNNEHKLLLEHINTLTSNVNWLKEELRETQRQLLQSWGSFITQQEEMRQLQTRIEDLERKMLTQKVRESSTNLTSQAKRVKRAKMLTGEPYTHNSTLLQNSFNKTKQVSTMTQMRCEHDNNTINNKNNCSCFVTKLRNGVSGLDAYGRSLANKRSHANKKSAIDYNSSSSHYCNMKSGRRRRRKESTRCICEEGKTSIHNAQLQEVSTDNIENNCNKRPNKLINLSHDAIVKKRVNASPELLLEPRDRKHERFVELEEQLEQCNPETSNGTTDRERSNLQDSSVPSDGSNTVWVSSIRRVSSAYIEHNNLSSFTNGFFVACDESDSTGELRQVIGPHVKYMNDINEINNNNSTNKQTLEDKFIEKKEKCNYNKRKSTSPFLVAVDSNDDISIMLQEQQQQHESEQQACNGNDKVHNKKNQEMEMINTSTNSAAINAERAYNKTQPLANVTNMLPKCNSCLNAKISKAYDKCNNTFQCQRIVDMKNRNNNTNKYCCSREKDREKLHATLPLLHHTHSVIFDMAHH